MGNQANSTPGIASYTDHVDQRASLYIATHLSRMAAFKISTEFNDQTIPQCTTKRVESPPLVRKLQTLLNQEDRRRNLGGLAVLKTWGLASLPNTDIVAACISIHGGDMPEYSLPSKERSTVLFASDGGQETFPWQDVPPSVKDVSIVQKDILRKISHYDSIEEQIGSAFSWRISQAASAAGKLLDRVEGSGEQVASSLEENCSICSQKILFKGLIEAACSQGHQFGKFATIRSTLIYANTSNLSHIDE